MPASSCELAANGDEGMAVRKSSGREVNKSALRTRRNLKGRTASDPSVGGEEDTEDQGQDSDATAAERGD